MMRTSRFTLPEIETKRLVGLTALFAMLLRYPGLMWPIRPDEAGFTLVARAWHAQPDSLYGTYWVDRPPPLIALVKLSDMMGGALFIRVIAAVGCALLVIAAARTAYLIAGDRAARWTALATAAVTTNTMIDAVAAKGEILGIPIVVTSFWLALEALRQLDASPRKAMLLAAGSGLLGMLAIGLKQNMATGLAFGGFVLLVSALQRTISWGSFWKLSGAALLGAAIPLAATIGWCLAAGVHLETLWYAVYGFRSHALDVIANDEAGAPLGRARQLALIFVVTGMAFIIGWFLIHLRHAWRTNAAVTVAAVAVLIVDGAGVVLGGSYWRPYLLGLVPTVVLCTALIANAPGIRGRVMQFLVGIALVSCLISSIGWTAKHLSGDEPPTEIYTGQAIKEAAEPGDTIVVYGGRADIVFASGLSSPYENLWSLPMRGNDPDLKELVAVLRNDKAPTWFVGQVDFTSWNETGQPALEAALADRYEQHGMGCGDHPIWLLKGIDRDVPTPDCDRRWLW